MNPRTKADVVLGFVDIDVRKSIASTRPSPDARQSPLDPILSSGGKSETDVPRFELSGQTPLIINWSKGSIRGESIWGTEFYSEGMRFCVLTINNVSVAATILAGKKTFAVLLLVLNRTTQNIDVVPSRFVLARDSGKPKQFAYVRPEKLADKIERDARRSAFWMALAGAFATSTSTTRSYTTGSLMGLVGSTPVSGLYSGPRIRRRRDRTLKCATLPSSKAEQPLLKEKAERVRF